jgi:hypothetical protein
MAEIGIGLTGMGLLFTFLGVMMFFDSGLLAVGNVFTSPSFKTRVRIFPGIGYCAPGRGSRGRAALRVPAA